MHAGSFGKHERSVRVARGAAESNSSFLSALDFFEAIVDSAFGLINYHLIEISSS